MLDEFGEEELFEGFLDSGAGVALVVTEPLEFAEGVEVFLGENSGDGVEALFAALFGEVGAD